MGGGTEQQPEGGLRWSCAIERLLTISDDDMVDRPGVHGGVVTIMFNTDRVRLRHTFSSKIYRVGRVFHKVTWS